MIASLNLVPVYRLLMRALGLVTLPFLHWRLARGKEEAERLQEKLGLPGRKRPPGRLAWLHGASVGEALALLPLVERLVACGLNVLVTTGTVSSARILAARLGPGAMHQYAPLDVPRFVSRFLTHWQPDIALVAESEIWPNQYAALRHAKIPLIMVNARLSQRSYLRWQQFAGTIAATLANVDICLAQTSEDGERLRYLGARHVEIAGNLKYDVPALPADNGEVAALAAAIGARPVWLAASTHPGEEAIVAEVHKSMRQRVPGLLTLMAPRHIDRADALVQQLKAMNLTIAQRSQNAVITPLTDIYLADTMGEMGLLYRLANIVLVGKSLDCGLAKSGGGQNPIEPAKLGNAILHGPHVANFTEAYARLDAGGGGLCIHDNTQLTEALAELLSERNRLRAMARAAQETMAQLGGATDHIMKVIDPYLAHWRAQTRAGG